MKPRIGRVLAIWILLMAVESLHGTLRTLYLAPLLGDAPARRLSVLTGAILIFLVTLFTVHWTEARSTRQLLGVGILWVALTVAFELMLGRLALGMTWHRIASDYDLAHGGLMIPGLIFMWFAPWLAVRMNGLLHRRRSR